MRFKWIAMAVVAVLAVPAGAQAESIENSPEHRPVMKRLLHHAIKQCKTEREATQAARPTEENTEGREEGREKIGMGRQAFRACVKQKMRELKAALKAAVEQCRTEREADPVAFREKYGRGVTRKGPAYRRCVFQHATASSSTI